MMNAPRILIAGVGNIFLGDDAFGVEVVRELLMHEVSENVRIIDFGIRGLDLAYALLDGYETVIVVDAVPRGGEPGQVYLIEPDKTEAPDPQSSLAFEAHRMDPARVLQLVSAMGGQVKKLLVVGCEPVPLNEYEDIQPGLSDAARTAIPVAVEWIMQLVDELTTNHEENLYERAAIRR